MRYVPFVVTNTSLLASDMHSKFYEHVLNCIVI